MLNYTRARADDVRALTGAIALGSGAGLLIGAAYLAGAHTRHPVQALPPVQAGNQAVALAGHTTSVFPSAQSLDDSALRGRFRLAGGFIPAVAQPFRFQRVAAAPTDLNCLAEAVYFEARGEEADGQKAVAQVVLNRVRHPAFPKTICAVVHQRSDAGCQFAFACSPRQAATDSLAWRRARGVATAALHGAVMGTVGDATHFETARSSAFAGLLRVAQVGAHVFYRFAGRNGATGMFHQTPAPSVHVGMVELARLDVSPGATGGGRIETVIDTSASTAPKLVSAASTPAPQSVAAVKLTSKTADSKLATAPESTIPAKSFSAGMSAPAKAPEPVAAKPAVALAQS